MFMIQYAIGHYISKWLHISKVMLSSVIYFRNWQCIFYFAKTQRLQKFCEWWVMGFREYIFLLSYPWWERRFSDSLSLFSIIFAFNMVHKEFFSLLGHIFYLHCNSKWHFDRSIMSQIFLLCPMYLLLSKG